MSITYNMPDHDTAFDIWQHENAFVLSTMTKN